MQAASQILRKWRRRGLRPSLKAKSESVPPNGCPALHPQEWQRPLKLIGQELDPQHPFLAILSSFIGVGLEGQRAKGLCAWAGAGALRMALGQSHCSLPSAPVLAASLLQGERHLNCVLCGLLAFARAVLSAGSALLLSLPAPDSPPW